jgi:lipoprotein-releasing system permease protein
MRLLLFLAGRGLLQSRVALALLVLAVAAGVGFQIPNTANLLGYNRELTEQATEIGAGEVRIKPRAGFSLDHSREVAALAAGEPDVRAAVPMLMVPGRLERGDDVVVLAVVGLDPDSARKPYRLVDGASLASRDTEGLLLGTALAQRFHVRPGDRIDLHILPVLWMPDRLQDEMVVRGVVKGALGASDWVIVDRRILGGGDRASEVMVYSGAPEEARALAARLAPKFPQLEVISWIDDSTLISSIRRANAVIAAVSQTMGVVSVAIPVWALLHIHVLRRRREIAILSGMGFHAKDVFLVFLLQAVAVGVLGVALGIGIGYLLIRYFQGHPIFEWEGLSVRPVLALDCFLRPSLLIFTTAVVAGIYPAWLAARIDPVPILRKID